MKVKKVLNNNVVIATDDMRREYVVISLGIAYSIKVGQEIPENRIERVFSSVQEKNQLEQMIEMIPQQYFDIAVEIIEYVQQVLNRKLSNSIYITLTDHINFVKERVEKGILPENSLKWEVRQYYPKEYQVSKKVVELLEDEFECELNDDEVASIAMHIINAEISVGRNEEKRNEDMIQDIIKIIEQYLKINIDKNGFNYSRFVSHMNYLFKRGKKGKYIFSKNSEMYDTLIKCYPKTNRIVEKITIYLEDAMKCVLTDDEKIYLILHVNRLCTREDCLSNR